MDISTKLGMTLDTDMIDALWSNDAQNRAKRSKRENYYDAKHAILDRTEKYGDGKDKSNIVTNWVGHIVDEHTGTISTYQVSSEEDAMEQAVKEYSTIAEDNFLASKDIDNRRNAFLFGYGIEVHSFNAEKGKIVIKNYPSNEWLIQRDSDGDIALAIRWVTLPEYTIYNQEVLTEDIELISVYTKTGYVHAEKRGEQWAIIEENTHFYGMVPVVQWRVDENSEGIVSDAIIKQNDEYNETDSANGDSVKIDVDSILKLKGIDSVWANENEVMIREKRMIPLPEGGDAEYMSRTFDTLRIQDRLDRTRKHIHIMGKVPDVANVVGATGGTSGIALKLLFSPMQRKSESVISFLKQGVSDRIELINAMWKKLNKPILEDYTITIQFVMPVNRIEEWQNIAMLNGIVSKKTMLELLTDINDPEAEFAKLEEEMANMPAEEETPEKQAIQGEQEQGEIDKKAVNFEETIGEMIENISTSVVDFMISSGAVDRVIKEKTNATS